MKPCDHDSYPLYKQLIEPLRERARELGYCLAVHGTLKRDIDLIANPWVIDAVPAKELAEELRKVAERVNGYAANHDREGASNPQYCDDGKPGYKPHGRLVWVFHLVPGARGDNAPYIDLSVMPRVQDADARPSLQYGDQAAYDALIAKAKDR